MVHWYVRNNGYGLTIIHVNNMVKKNYDYVMMGLGFIGCFVIGATCWNVGHGYGFVSSMGHSRSEY